MRFQLLAKDQGSSARAGVITTAHGQIETPIFMPVGTAGSVKAVHQRELETDIGAQIILGNTYHLYLRPGIPLLEKAGGLHKFNGWGKPILTDSGGYQVYSMAGNRKISESGVAFKSHIDGSSHAFTPEAVMDIQRSIGADIIMAFDECTPYPCEYDYASTSLNITHRFLLGLFSSTWIVTWVVWIFLMIWLMISFAGSKTFLSPETYLIVVPFLLRWIVLLLLFSKMLKRTSLSFPLWTLPVLDFVFAIYYLSTGLVALTTKKIRWRN